MRTLSLFSYLFLLLLVASIVMVALGNNTWLIIGCLVTTLASGTAATFLWLRAVRRAVIESQALISKTPVKARITFANVDALTANHAGIAKKFETSAAFISNLSNTDKLSAM